jgi:hypothetical protein
VLDPFNPLGDTFVGTITLENKPTTCPPTACPPPPNPPRYQTYPAPPSAAGAATSGEPSIGVDWTPNVAGLKHGTVNRGGGVFFTSNFNEYRVDLDDCSSPAIVTWTDVTTPIETDPASLDPIGFCDHQGPPPAPGRVFQSQLAAAAGSLTAFSDTDGNSWTQSQGGGQPAGVDHQSIGSGPYDQLPDPEFSGRAFGHPSSRTRSRSGIPRYGLLPGNSSSFLKDSDEHLPRQFAGLGILVRGMIGSQQRAAVGHLVPGSVLEYVRSFAWQAAQMP